MANPDRAQRLCGLLLTSLLLIAFVQPVALFAQKFPDKVTEGPLPAELRVTNPQPLVGVPLTEIAVGSVPDYLEGAIAVTRKAGKYPDHEHAGRIELEMAADGPVFLSVSWSYEGYVPNEMWYEFDFRDQGWVPMAHARLFNTVTRRLEPTTLYYRQCKAGDRFQVRTRKKSPPIPIVPAKGAKLPGLAKFEPATSLPELAQYETIRAKAAVLLDTGRFDDLETWAGGYVRDDSHFPSGHSKIAEVCYPFSYPLSNETEAKFERRNELMEKWLAAKPNSTAARLVRASSAVRFSVFLRYNRKVADGEARADDEHRRANQLLHDIQQSGVVVPFRYEIAMNLADAQDWDEHLIKEFAGQALKTGKWCPEVVSKACFAMRSRISDDPAAIAKINIDLRAFLETACTALRQKYGEAIYAAAFMEINRINPGEALNSGFIDWPHMKQGFEDLEKHFPNSRRNLLLFARFAAAAGDRATAGPLFARLGEIDINEEDVWSRESQLKSDRAFTAADFTAGDQSLLIEHPTNSVAGADWFDRESRIALADGGGNVYTLPATGGKPKFYINATVQSAEAIDLASQGDRLLVGSNFANLSVVGVKELDSIVKFKLKMPTGHVSAVRLSNDRRWAVAGNEHGDVAVFDIADESLGSDHFSFQEPKVVYEKLHTKWVRLVGFSQDGSRLITVSEAGTVVICDPAKKEILKTWKAHEQGIMAAALSPKEDRVVTIARHGGLAVWDLDGNRLADAFRKMPRTYSAAISPDGTILALGQGSPSGVRPENIELLELKNFRLLKTLSGHKAVVMSLIFSADGKSLLSSSFDKSLRIWDVPKP